MSLMTMTYKFSLLYLLKPALTLVGRTDLARITDRAVIVLIMARPPRGGANSLGVHSTPPSFLFSYLKLKLLDQCRRSGDDVHE